MTPSDGPGRRRGLLPSNTQYPGRRKPQRTEVIDPDPWTIVAALSATTQVAFELARSLIRHPVPPRSTDDELEARVLRRALTKWGTALHTLRPIVQQFRTTLEDAGVNLGNPVDRLTIEFGHSGLRDYYDGLRDLFWAVAEMSSATLRLVRIFEKQGYWMSASTAHIYEKWKSVTDEVRKSAKTLGRSSATPENLRDALARTMEALESLDELETVLREVYFPVQ